MNQNFVKDLKSILKGTIKQSVPLSSLVTFKIGGDADCFFEPNSQDDLVSCLEYVHKSGISFFVLGSGSNLLVSDEGFRGLVIHLGPTVHSSVETLFEDEDFVFLRVPAWHSKAALLRSSVLMNLSGLEFSAGIPGTLGGAVFMNAGTKWGSYSDVIEKVHLYHFKEGLVSKICSEMGFKYRGHGETSVGREAVVLSVDIKLKKNKSNSASKNLIQEILSYRGSRQPLERPNCGSVFKNPENSSRGAGRLIEACGLKKFKAGGAMLSDKHANFILNVDRASADDVKRVIGKAEEEVFKRFSVQLEREVIFV